MLISINNDAVDLLIAETWLAGKRHLTYRSNAHERNGISRKHDICEMLSSLWGDMPFSHYSPFAFRDVSWRDKRVNVTKEFGLFRRRGTTCNNATKVTHRNLSPIVRRSFCQSLAPSNPATFSAIASSNAAASALSCSSASFSSPSLTAKSKSSGARSATPT